MKLELDDHSIVVATQIGRVAEDPNSARVYPGAFEADNTDHQLHPSNNSDHSTSGNSGVSSDVCEGRVLVLDGVVVQPPPQRKKKHVIEAFGLIIFVLLLVFMFVRIVEISTNKEIPKHVEQDIDTFTPSLSPSISSQPTKQVQTILRDIIIPISGEEKLYDPTTPQHYSFSKLIVNIPYLEEMLFLDKTNRIVQRYVILVVLFTFSSDFKATYELQPNRRLPDECTIFDCNDDEEITAFVFQNEWMSPLGGGFIASEIGYLKGLIYLIIDNNALKGTLPTEIGNLERLQLIDTAKNNLSGTIPTQLEHLTRLKYIFLDMNKLTSTIPSEFGNIIELNHINLSNNSLSGTIPSELERFEKLRSFSFERTDIHGSADFLCDNNFTRMMVTEQIVIGMSFFTFHTYKFSAYSGIIMGCPVMDTSPLCSCCICNEL